MSRDVLLVALIASATAMAASAALVPPRRSLASRLRPYSGLARSRLGTGHADLSVVSLTSLEPAPTGAGVISSIIRWLADRLGSVMDAASSETLHRRLRQAGLKDATPEQYRIRQLGWTCVGLSLGVCLGLTLLGSIGGTLLLAALFGFPAATVQRNRIERGIESRRQAMRADVYTVAQLLAVHVRTGHGPVDAVREVVALGRGPLIEELNEGLGWIAGGISPQSAYEELAETTPEPAAARLYRLMSSSARSGGDIGAALLAVADDLRTQRREELARRAVKRRTAMLMPLLLLIAPVMVLFVGAALPSLVLGPGP